MKTRTLLWIVSAMALAHVDLCAAVHALSNSRTMGIGTDLQPKERS